MKYLVSLVLILSMDFCFAQDSHLLRIVSYSGSVTLDGQPVSSGQLVSAPSKKLVVGNKNSYAYVLTPAGYSIKLTQGNYPIDRIEKYIYREKYKPRTPFTTAVMVTPSKMAYVGYHSSTHPYLMHDSAYFKWKKGYSTSDFGPPYHFRITSMFEDVLYETDTNLDFIKLDLRKIAGKEKAVLINVNSEGSFIVKFLEKKDFDLISSDLAKIESGPEKSILDLVIYDCNPSLSVDLMFELDKVLKKDTSAIDSDLRNYLALLKTRYEFE